jgi:hypothetical protein
MAAISSSSPGSAGCERFLAIWEDRGVARTGVDRRARPTFTPDSETIMRQMLVPVVLSACLLSSALAQTGPATPETKPCSLLTRELVEKASAGGKQTTAAAKPQEVSLGGSRRGCQWGDVMVQVDPHPAARLGELSKSDPKNWESISGVGDAAYFHNVQDAMAEMFVRVGPRTLGILIDVPVGSKAAAVKPKLVELAQAIVPKLR